MDTTLAECGETEFDYTRIHPNPSFEQNDVVNVESESSPFEYSAWGNLPSVVLVEVYKYLSSNDKFNASLTCKAWSQTIKRPEVWRNSLFHLRFNGVDGWKALQCPTALVQAMSHLIIECYYEKNSNHHRKERATANLNNFLMRLVTLKTCQLITLKIVVSGYISYNYLWFSQDTILTLQELISMQTRMKHLDLTRAQLDTEIGIDLLKTISTACGSSLNELSMDNLFTINSQPGSVILWKKFSSLTDLTISQSCLSDYLLEALSVSGSLIRLTVSVSTNGLSRTSTDAWEQLTVSCPLLEARFSFDKETSLGFTIHNVLIPGIPLVTLEVFVSRKGKYWNFNSNRIASEFKNTLRRLVLVFQNRLFWKDDFLDSFIKSCVHLEEISLTVKHNLLFFKADILESVQRSLAHQPNSHMKRFYLNGEEIDLTGTSIQN